MKLIELLFSRRKSRPANWIDFWWVKGGCKPQATSQKERQAAGSWVLFVDGWNWMEMKWNPINKRRDEIEEIDGNGAEANQKRNQWNQINFQLIWWNWWSGWLAAERNVFGGEVRCPHRCKPIAERLLGPRQTIPPKSINSINFMKLIGWIDWVVWLALTRLSLSLLCFRGPTQKAKKENAA